MRIGNKVRPVARGGTEVRRRGRTRAGERISAAIESLEQRVLFAGTAPDADLGTIGTSPTPDNSRVSLQQGHDSDGNFFSTPVGRVLRLTLASPANQLSLTASGANAGSGANGNMLVQFARDANGDGQLEQSELSAPVAPSWTVTSDQANASNDSVTLGAGTYFLNLSLTNFNPDSSLGVFEADVDYNMSATSTAVSLPGITVSDGGAIQNGSSATSSANGTDFGSAQVGASTSAHTFTIANTGDAALTLGAANLSNGDFNVVSGPPTSIAGHSSGTFSIQLLTSSAGQKASTVSIATNVSGKNPFTFAVSGSVAAPQLPSVAVSIGNQQLTNGQSAAVSFGAATVGASAPTRIFTVQNNGNANLTVGSVSVTAGFTLVSGLSGPIAAGASATFTVQMNTTTPGSPNGSISFATNDPTATTFGFPIAGAVSSAPVAVAAVSDGNRQIANGQSTAVSFGTAPAGATAPTQLFTVQNNGNASLTVGAVSVPAGFAVVGGLASPIAPGTSATLTVQMNTTTAGNPAGSVSFTTNDPSAATFSFPISGTVSSVSTNPPPPDPANQAFGVTKVTTLKIPASIVGGQKTSTGMALVTLQNLSGAPLTGSAAITVFGSSSNTSVSGDSIMLGHGSAKLKLKAAQSLVVKVKLTVPSVAADSTFFIVAQATGTGITLPAGVTGAASNSVLIRHPFVALQGPGAAGGLSAKAGKPLAFSLLLSNQGDVAATGSVSLDLLLSTDGTLATAISLPTLKQTINLKPNAKKPLKLKVTIAPSTVAGSYVLLVRLRANGPLAALNQLADGQIVASFPMNVA